MIKNSFRIPALEFPRTLLVTGFLSSQKTRVSKLIPSLRFRLVLVEMKTTLEQEILLKFAAGPSNFAHDILFISKSDTFMVPLLCYCRDLRNGKRSK